VYKLKRYLLILVTLLILPSALLCVSCTNDTKAIEDVVTEFITAYKNQQYSICLDYMSNKLRDSEGDQALITRLQVARLFTGTSTIRSIGTPTITKTKATIWVDLVGPFNLTSSVELTLIKEDGNWKIHDF
jgi:hypothetical protein